MDRRMHRPFSLVFASAVGALILLAGFVPQRLGAVPEYTPKEQKACDFCHPGGDIFALNQAGMYYAERHSLEGFPTEDAPGQPAPANAPRPDAPKPEGEAPPPPQPVPTK